jgi:FkbM family methyltransferase
MKQYLLRNSMGRVAMFIRDKVTILKLAYLSPETVGTVASDLLATKLVTTICKPGATFVDVGAHIGSIISEVKHNIPSARIVAVEAIPDKVEKLQQYFPFAEIHSCAVGESTANISFFINTLQSGYSSLARPINGNEKSIVEITVPIKRLDDLVLSNDVDVIKIDVEGAELGVLRGSVNILDRCRPTIMFESSPQSDIGLGYTKEALYEFLASKGYSIVVPNRVAHDGPGLTLEGFLESHFYPRRTTNYLAIPRERRIEIRDRARSVLNVPGE